MIYIYVYALSTLKSVPSRRSPGERAFLSVFLGTVPYGVVR